MKRLIKRHSIGGIAEAVDSALEPLGTYGKLGVQILDPTGVTGWKDFGDSYKEFTKEKSLGNFGGLLLAGLGVIPMIGGVGRASKVAKAADKTTDSAKLVSKTKRVLDSDTYKLLIDPKEPPALWMRKNFTPEMKQEAVKILDKEIDKVIDWCKSKNLKRIPKSMQEKILNLDSKRKMFLELHYEQPSIINVLNLELQ